MEAEGKVGAAASSELARAPTAARKPGERAFWVALACAAVAHVTLIAGFMRSLPQRQMGEKGGSSEGVSVAMVDAADLNSQSTFAEERAVPRSAAPAHSTRPVPQAVPVPEQPPPEAAPPQADEKTPAPVSPEQAAKLEEAAKHDQAVKQDRPVEQRKPDEKQDNAAWPIDLKALEQGYTADRPAQPRDAAPSKQAATPPHHTAKASPPLQLSLPDSAIGLNGLSASFSRPPGITRSGENDEFGRGVIRALRKTMPDPGSMRGRVTVRIVLSEDGNLVEVRLVRSSGDQQLDQSVLFAVQQSSFPFPPPRAPLIDRMFVVTYIYESRDSR